MNAGQELESRPSWYYNEEKHAGVDYADERTAAKYDARHAEFRDFKKDAGIIMDRISLKPEHAIIDLGCGTGAFVIPAAEACRKVHAVDVSPAMLAVCARKAKEKGLHNIVTHNAGFLTYIHDDEPADAIITVAALHHLPDFWKMIALKRMHEMLKPGGKLYIFDVVFSFAVEDFKFHMNGWVESMRQKANPAMAEETIIHIRDEFSTFDWILDGMLTRTGFTIEQKFSGFPYCFTYICRR